MTKTPGEPQKYSVPWRTRDVVRVTIVVLATIAIAQLLWATRAVVLTAFLGILFGIAIAAGADRLERFRIPRAAGAALIVLAFLGLLGGFGTWIGPTVRDQTTELRTRLPEAVDKLEHWIEDQGGGVISTILGLGNDSQREVARPPVGTQPPGDTLPGTEPVIAVTEDDTGPTLRERVLEQIGGARRYFLPLLTHTVAVVVGIVLVIFLAIYVAIDPKTYRKGALYLVPDESRERAERILTAVTVMMRRWLVTQLIAMVVIGVVTTVALVALQVRAAVPLGMLAGLLEFIPTIGPILSAVPAIAMGFVDSPQKALYVVIAYSIIQFIENQVLIPVLMKEGIDLPPALTLLVQALMAIVFGFLGLLVAVPLLAAVLVSIRTARETRESGKKAATGADG
jgi:predicted PurR-regulated permease PerM